LTVRGWVLGAGAALLVAAAAEFVLLGVLIWHLGLPWTLALLIVKSVLGYLLVRRVGRRGWRQFRAAVDTGRPPGREVTDATVAVTGATLVMLTGFIGAAAGLVLLVPPVRRAAAGLAERTVERRLSTVAAGGVFGPRRVHAERLRPDPARADGEPDTAADGGPAAPGPEPGPPPVIEGEILPPR
jgi:UPF0716 protein FxsA